jgi:hypothetical protein
MRAKRRRGRSGDKEPKEEPKDEPVEEPREEPKEKVELEDEDESSVADVKGEPRTAENDTMDVVRVDGKAKEEKENKNEELQQQEEEDCMQRHRIVQAQADEESEANSLAILDGLVDLMAQEVVAKLHREVMTGIMSTEELYAPTRSEPMKSFRELQEASSKEGLDVFGRVPSEPSTGVICHVCGRSVSVLRFAVHLDKCLMGGRGTRSGRVPQLSEKLSPPKPAPIPRITPQAKPMVLPSATSPVAEVSNSKKNPRCGKQNSRPPPKTHSYPLRIKITLVDGGLWFHARSAVLPTHLPV